MNFLRSTFCCVIYLKHYLTNDLKSSEAKAGWSKPRSSCRSWHTIGWSAQLCCKSLRHHMWLLAGGIEIILRDNTLFVECCMSFHIFCSNGLILWEDCELKRSINAVCCVLDSLFQFSDCTKQSDIHSIVGWTSILWAVHKWICKI